QDAAGNVIPVDTAAVAGHTLTAFAGGLNGIAMFTLTLNADGSWTYETLAPINHTPFGDNIATDNHFDLSSLVQVVSGNGATLTLGANTLVMTVTDDVPVLRAIVEGEVHFVPTVTGTVDEGGIAADQIGTEGNNPGAPTVAFGNPGSLFSLVEFGADGPNAT